MAFSRFKEKDLKKLLLPELKALALEYGCNRKLIQARKKAILIDFLIDVHDDVENCTSSANDGGKASVPLLALHETNWQVHFTKLDDNSIHHIPAITFSTIYDYCTTKTSTKTSFKSFDRAVKHVDAGDVHDLQFHKDGNDMFFNGKVFASQRAKEYNVLVRMAENAVITDSTCQCPVGLASKCSHVGALLFCLEDVKRRGSLPSKTSKKSTWNVPRPKSLEMHTLDNIKLSKARYNSETSEVADRVEKLGFDPRHKSDQIPWTEEEQKRKVQDLMDVSPNCCLGHAWGLSSQPPHAQMQVEVSTAIQFGNLNHLKNLHINLDSASVKDKANEMFSSIKISQEDANTIEEETRGQSTNSMWHIFRAGRITSSNMKTAINTKLSNPSRHLINSVCYPQDQLVIQVPAIIWGKKHENTARSKYCWIQKQVHQSFNVNTPGLIVHPDYAYLGASPDGRVDCKCCGKGVLEIKCPYSIRDKNVTNEVSFLKDEGNGLFLDKSHPYFYQVQTQMFLTCTSYCDFVVYTTKDLLIRRIKKDDRFCESIIQRAKGTYKNIFLPELLAQIFTRSTNFEQ